MEKRLMKALVKAEPKAGISYQDVPIPECGPDDILVKVMAAGICGSDVHMYEWTPNYEFSIPYMPFIMGHEFCGVVAETGKNITSFKPGDRVFCRCFFIDGTCEYCSDGKQHFCRLGDKRLGLHMDGGFAEYCLMPENGLIKLPDSISFERGAMIEPMYVTANAVYDSQIRFGDFCVVQGPGPIGLMTLLFAKARGAGKCVMLGTRRDEKRMELAKEFGADYMIYGDEEDAQKRILELTDGMGADIVFECTGVPQMVQKGLDVIKKSGTLVAVGIYPAKAELDLTSLVRSAKNIKGTYGGPVTLERLISWLDSSNPLVEKLDKLITHRSSIKNANEAFERCVRKENIKELFVNFD